MAMRFTRFLLLCSLATLASSARVRNFDQVSSETTQDDVSSGDATQDVNDNPCAEVPLKYCKKESFIFERKRHKFTQGSRAQKNLCHEQGICVPADTTCVAAYDEADNGRKWCKAVSRPDFVPPPQPVDNKGSMPPPQAVEEEEEELVEPQTVEEEMMEDGTENPCANVPKKYCKKETYAFENKRNKFTSGSQSTKNLCHDQGICVPVDTTCTAAYDASGKKWCKATSRPKPYEQVPMNDVETPDPEDVDMQAENMAPMPPAEVAEEILLLEDNTNYAQMAVSACRFVPKKYCKPSGMEFENKRRKFTAGWYQKAKSAGAKYDCSKYGTCVPEGYRCVRKYTNQGKAWCGACQIGGGDSSLEACE